MINEERNRLFTSFDGYIIRMYAVSLGITAVYAHHLRQDGEWAVLVRDSKRILKVKLAHALPLGKTPQLIALPWNSSHFELRVNQTVYHKGPVILSAGDKLQLCLRCGWSDDYTFEITAASTSGGCSPSHDLAPVEKHATPRDVSLHGDPIIIETQKEERDENAVPLEALSCDCRRALINSAAEEFIKWSNFYAYRYNNLHRNMDDVCPSLHLRDATAAVPRSSRNDFIQSESNCNSPIDMKSIYLCGSHAKMNMDTFTVAGSAKAGQTILSNEGTLLEQRRLPEHFCCMCPLLDDVLKEQALSFVKPVASDLSPWQEYVMSRIA